MSLLGMLVSPHACIMRDIKGVSVMVNQYKCIDIQCTMIKNNIFWNLQSFHLQISWLVQLWGWHFMKPWKKQMLYWIQARIRQY